MRLANVMLLNRFHGLCGPRNLMRIVPPPIIMEGEYILNLNDISPKSSTRILQHPTIQH